jgi:DNA excision repair protein ERCC-4
MRALLVGKLHLWPRFESRIIEDLNTRQPEVVELAVPLTDRMAAMWTALHTLTIAIVDEIKKTQLVLDLPLPTMENVFQEDWHDLIQSQLGGQRNLVGDNTRNLLLDLKTMNQMRSGLLHYDCVMFNRFLETIKMEKLVNHSDWLFHDAADVLFSNAKSRVVVQPPAPLADHEGGAVFMLEPQPKWNVLREVLAEIRGENVDCNVLIVVRDQRVAMQVSGVLSKGESPWLMEQFTTSIDRGMYRARSTAPSRHSSFHGGGESKKKKAKGKGRSSSVVVPKRSIADMFPEAAKKKDSKVGKLPVAGAAPSMEEAARRDDFERSFGPMKRAIEIYSLDSGSDVASCLERLNPPFVVMYDTDLAFLRSLECYKNTAQGSSHPMRVYLLSYDVDSDDTRDLERENEGFEKLIVVKGTMLVEAERGQVVRASSPWDEVSSSRVGGGGISGGALARPYIVTDTRELKGSKIPAKLWSCGFDVNALQLEIGDYVVSNDVVIERKTVPDLISSFADGRLFKQCTNMTQHYQVVILLLEFNGSAFALQAKSKIEPHVSVAALSSKLALLALHFPKLRVFWSRDTSQSVEFIRALRASGGSALMLQHPQRDADLDRIAKTSVLSSRQGGDEVVDMTARLMLSKMPGVLAGTLDGVAQKAKTIRALCSNWNTAEYAPIMGRENAVLLGTFLTTIYAKDDDDA